MNRKGRKSQNRGYMLFEMEDFVRLKYLRVHSWYYMSEHGEGIAVHFKIKVKPFCHGHLHSIYLFITLQTAKCTRLNSFHWRNFV